MKRIKNFFTKVLFWYFDQQDKLKKSKYLEIAEDKLFELELDNIRYNNDESAKKLSDAKRLVSAIKDCPAPIVMDELEPLLVLRKDQITDAMCLRFVETLELYKPLEK